jgi:hypothetical protein
MLLLIVSLLLLVLLALVLNKKEMFIGIPTRNTRNMSYDLRGDPCVIRPNHSLSPWGMSSISMGHHRPGTPYCTL